MEYLSQQLLEQLDRKSERISNAINQQDIINIYGILHPVTAEDIFFSSVHKALTKTNHILGYKTNLNKH